MYIYLDRDYFDFYFTCDNKLKSDSIEEEDFNHIRVELTLDKKENKVLVEAYECFPVKSNDHLYTVELPFRKGEKYKICYKFIEEEDYPYTKYSDNVYYIKSSIQKFNTDETVSLGYVGCGGVIADTENYLDTSFYISKSMSPKLAKKSYKDLKKNKLVGKTHWDGWYHSWDMNCYACHTPGFSYTSLCTPGSGRVLELKPENHMLNKDMEFFFKGKVYRKLSENEWFHIRFYNEKEFKEHALFYKPKRKRDTWYNSTEWDKLSKWGKLNVDFDKAFNDVYKKEGHYYYRDNTGKVEQFVYAPTIGAYERVCSPDYLEWLLRFDFDKKWKEEGYYRDGDGYIKNKDWISNPKDLEKVVTLGECIEPYKGSVSCPVCEEIYRIATASKCWLPMFYNLRSKFNELKWKIVRRRKDGKKIL